MKASEIIDLFRARSEDETGPHYLTDDALALRWISEADLEMAQRSFCLRDEGVNLATQIDVVDGVGVYDLHSSVLQVLDAWLVSTPGCHLDLVPEADISRQVSQWRTASGRPKAIVPMGLKQFRLVYVPEADDTLQLSVYRCPLAPVTKLSDTPETPAGWHNSIVDWMLYRHFGRPNADSFNAQLSANAYNEFEAAVGPRRSLNQAVWVAEGHRNTTLSNWP